ncbi:thioredoxin-like protein [Didymella exigua CBS 183.55]|uniref:Thioredoxin-like protein n=1 Tax=Didymella exigua CBS 183.55 TaxID=1150837 RepID=A0A6A5RGQ8_9PLEO|nr:thioredoxin-like protein [Didymella exigua CBS 183.55]KAF1927495.1 thioredoxin-like protein [Didymella exigua CBS 183.55]
MSQLGQVRIGHKAPDFHCEAVIGGAIKEVSLNTFIRPSKLPSTPDPNAPWLLLLFIPAAFSFVCPTEVIAFQNCYDEFRDRNCSIAFISVDTKHSLWHWQNVPRQYGGLGNIDIPLLSDATHKIGRDYGVLVEEEGVCLRGMFIIDGEGRVQQITLNNLTVGRSVLEALRLLEAFQAVAKHGVLCPIDWKPSAHASDTMSTISNTLVESYEDRLANLQKEFGDVPVTNLDAKHRAPTGTDDIPHAEFVQTPRPKVNITPTESSNDVTLTSSDARDPPASPGHTNCVSRVDRETFQEQPVRSISDERKLSRPPSPVITVATPVSTPNTQERTARHNRGRYAAHQNQTAHSASSKRPAHSGPHPLTYESKGGSHVTLEFADPTAIAMVNPSVEKKAIRPPAMRHRATSPPPRVSTTNGRTAPVLGRAMSWSGGFLKRENSSAGTPPLTPTQRSGSPGPGQTRLQATFQAFRNMGAGLGSPRVDASPSKQGERNRGYFDVTTEEPENQGEQS